MTFSNRRWRYARFDAGFCEGAVVYRYTNRYNRRYAVVCALCVQHMVVQKEESAQEVTQKWRHDRYS